MESNKKQISPEEFSKRLGERLGMLRYERNLSQNSVAGLAGISLYTYQKYEKGESKPGTPMNPQLHTLMALADVFEMNVWDLINFDDN